MKQAASRRTDMLLPLYSLVLILFLLSACGGETQGQVAVCNAPGCHINQVQGDSAAGGPSNGGTSAPQPPPPTPTPAPTPLPTATPTPSPPGAGTQLFPANGGNWSAGWSGGDDWHTSGNLMLNSGQNISTSIAPYHPGDYNVNDYAVELQMQLNRFSDAGAMSGRDSFGILVRSPDGRSGYTFSVCASAFTMASCGTQDRETLISNGQQNIAENPYVPKAGEWHTYRVEVKGNSIKVLIDGTIYLSTTDNSYFSGGEVGLSSERSQISIQNFHIVAL